MLSLRIAIRSMLLISSAIVLTACKNGGDVTLESGAHVVKSQGSPYVQVNEGGKSLIIENGKTVTTGVHGWVTVQAITSTHLSSSSGTNLIMNRPQSVP
jgi:hypothetical protein